MSSNTVIQCQWRPKEHIEKVRTKGVHETMFAVIRLGQAVSCGARVTCTFGALSLRFVHLNALFGVQSSKVPVPSHIYLTPVIHRAILSQQELRDLVANSKMPEKILEHPAGEHNEASEGGVVALACEIKRIPRLPSLDEVI